MKRGGLAIALVIVLTGVLRWMSPAGIPLPGARDASHMATKGEPKDAGNAGSSRALPQVHSRYAEGIESALLAYFGLDAKERSVLKGTAARRGRAQTVPGSSSPETLEERARHWFVPSPERAHLRFVIATLPDPAHTQLNLYFDRGVQAIEQAAQESGYNFDRAAMPWDLEEHPQSTDFEKREAETADRSLHETFPGLLVFRRMPVSEEKKPETNSAPHTLLVLIVGEAPTGGIRKDQFANALSIIRDIQEPSKPASAKNLASPQGTLLVLGPTFSGSLYSLARALELNRDELAKKPVLVFSGVVRGTGPRCAFESELSENVTFVPFQDNESHLIQQFLNYAESKGYEASDIAVLSEDETAYGVQPPSAGGVTTQDTQPKTGKREAACGSGSDWKKQELMQSIQFPRGISQFRSAYVRQTGLASAQRVSGEGRPVLPLDLEATGNEDDSVAPYAKAQFPLSQEAVMLGIISRLQQRHPRLIILRSSDPVDQLFLARYLRQNYPQGRIVVTSPDLLFAREDDGLLHGVLGLSSYPLVPDVDSFLARPDRLVSPASQRAFPTTNDMGTYNAMVGLLAAEAKVEADTALGGKTSFNLLPVGGRYRAYGSFVDWRNLSGDDRRLYPDDWVTILGRDGYWALEALPNYEKSGFHGLAGTANYPPKSESKGAANSGSQEDGARKAQQSELTRHTTKAWAFVYACALLALVIQTILICFGSIFVGSEAQAQFGLVEIPDEPGDLKDYEQGWSDVNRRNRIRRALLLAIGTAALATICIAMAGVRYASMLEDEGEWSTVVLCLLPLVPVFLVGHSLATRRGARLVGVSLVSFFTALAILMNLNGWGPRGWMHGLTAYRAIHLNSGVSPLLPFLMLLGAAYCLSWFELQGLAVVDSRRARLPERKDVPRNYFRVSDEEVQQLRHLTVPLTLPWPVLKVILLLIPLLLLSVSGDWRPIQSMEGMWYDRAYAAALSLSLLAFLGCLFRLLTIWHECRRFLGGLDNLPLRDAFRRLQDFTWNLVWSPSGSAIRDSYKLVSRELECIEKLRHALEKKDQSGAGLLSEENIKSINAQLAEADEALLGTQAKYLAAMEARKQWLHRDDPMKTGELMRAFAQLQKRLGRVAGVVMSEALVRIWKEELTPVASNVPRTAAASKTPFQRIAEEYVSLVYANFLVGVLLRMRTLVMEAIGIYFFLLLSISFYPFEPNPDMFTLAVLLITVMAVVVGYVYAQMHRDPALSRLTSTAEGELGMDFWLQFIGAGAVPVLSLLAVQFPAVSRIVNGLLEPGLQSFK